MAIDNLALTYGFDFDTIVGKITLDERIEKFLVEGEIFTLSASVIEVGKERRVTGITLIPAPSVRG